MNNPTPLHFYKTKVGLKGLHMVLLKVGNTSLIDFKRIQKDMLSFSGVLYFFYFVKTVFRGDEVVVFMHFFAPRFLA